MHRRTGQRVAVLVDEYDKPILDALDVTDVARANRDFLRGLYAIDEGRRRARPALHVPDRSQQVLEGQPVLRPQQPDGHHARSAILRPSAATRTPTWIRCSRRSSRGSTATRSGPGTTATVGSAPTGSTTPSTSCCSSDRREFDAWWFETGTPEVPRRHVAGARRRRRRPRRHGRQRRPVVVVRRRRHRDRGAAVPDRLSHDSRHGIPWRQDPLSARLSEPRGAPEPERAAAARHDARMRHGRGRARSSSTKLAAAPTTSPG